MQWIDSVAGVTRLANAPGVLGWNLDKHYLIDLGDAGVPVVPTMWVDPPAGSEGAALPEGEFVVKPTISGGGFATARYEATPSAHEQARAHITELAAMGRAAMLQPYQAGVDGQGETALVYLGGAFSHAFSKAALLHPGVGPQDHLYQNEQIAPCTATPAQHAVAEAALAVAAQHGPVTYGRADLVPLADGSPAVLELEVLDPALYLETAGSAAVARYADVLRTCLD